MERLVKQKSQITAHDFRGGLRKAGFAVEDGEIVDVSGSALASSLCPCFTVMIWVDRNATLANVIRQRDEEIERGAASG